MPFVVAPREGNTIFRSHWADSIGQPAIAAVATAAKHAAIRGFQQERAHPIGRLVPAAPARHLQWPTVSRAAVDCQKLLQDAVVAARDAASAVAKQRAMSAPLAWMQERDLERREWDVKRATQALKTDGPQLRHDSRIGIDVRSHQARHDGARERVHRFEFPQNRHQRFARIELAHVKNIAQRRRQTLLVERQDREIVRSGTVRWTTRWRVHGRLHGATARSRNDARREPIMPGRGSSPAHPSSLSLSTISAARTNDSIGISSRPGKLAR